MLSPFHLKNHVLIPDHTMFLVKCYLWQALHKLPSTATHCLQLIPSLAMSKGRKNHRRVSPFNMLNPDLWRSTPTCLPHRPAFPQALHIAPSRLGGALYFFRARRKSIWFSSRLTLILTILTFCWKRGRKSDNSDCHLCVCLCESVWVYVFPATAFWGLYLCEATEQGEFQAWERNRGSEHQPSYFLLDDAWKGTLLLVWLWNNIFMKKTKYNIYTFVYILICVFTYKYRYIYRIKENSNTHVHNTLLPKWKIKTGYQ
jgi:hypothetical protein